MAARDIKRTVARCKDCLWSGYLDECETVQTIVLCPKCEKDSVIEYEQKVVGMHISKSVVDIDHEEPKESGLDEHGRVKKRWWQK